MYTSEKPLTKTDFLGPKRYTDTKLQEISKTKF